MKLRPEQLGQHASKQLLPIYLISGDEILLVQEACDTLRKSCRKAGFTEREILHADTNFDWNQLLSAGSSLSLFSERKLIELRLKGKPGRNGGEALIEYAQQASPDNVLLIITGKLDAASQKTKWCKTLESVGAFVQVWPIDAHKLPQWIGQRLRNAGLKVSPAATELLAERVEGNLLAAAQEIEKLQLQDKDEAINADTIAAIVSDNARFDVFQLTDKVLAGNAAAGLRILNSLKAEGVEPSVLLWALTREIRTLARIASNVSQGNRVDSALQQERVWERRKPLFKGALSRLPLHQLEKLLQQAGDIDRSIKGLSDGRVWDKMRELVLQLAGKRWSLPTSPHLS